MQASFNEQLLRGHGALQALGQCPAVTVGFVALPDMAERELFEDVGILNWDFAAEGWVGDNNIEEANGFMAAQCGFLHVEGSCKVLAEIGLPRVRRQKGISLEYVAAAVVVHDHVHFGGFDQIGIEIEAEEVRLGDFGDALLEKTLFVIGPLRLGALPFLDEAVFESLNNLVHGNNEEAPGAARWIEHLVVASGGQHFDGHVHDVARG